LGPVYGCSHLHANHKAERVRAPSEIRDPREGRKAKGTGNAMILVSLFDLKSL
jgi:hypothetical protein